MEGTVVETYLRNVRGFGGAIPPTIGFLPAREKWQPCMISAFAVSKESDDGGLLAPGQDGVVAVHLTKLAADGMGKAGTDTDKIVVGSPIAAPIVVASLTDGLGLVIAEGIEDALSMNEATGIGAWAAGSAPLLPHLASVVPSRVEAVTIVVDDDKAGRRKSEELAALLEERGDCEVRMFFPARVRGLAA